MVGTTKYTDEQIHFILDRTVRVIPRGDTSKVHDQAVQDFKKRYGLEDFGVNQVRYVTERYGSDPLYGNRWANMIKGHARSSSTLLSFDDDYPLPNNLTPSAKRSLQKGNRTRRLVCEHCSGLGTIPINRPRESQTSFGERRGTAPQLPGEPPRVIDYSAYRSQSSQLPTDRFPLSDYQQEQSSIPLAGQPVWNTHLRTHDSSSTPETPTGIARADPGRGNLSGGAGSRLGPERPLVSTYSMHQASGSNGLRNGQARPRRTTTASVAPPQSSGIPGMSINEYTFDREMSARSSPHYSVPTTMSGTPHSQITYPFQSRAFESGPLGHTSTNPSSTLPGKRYRSTSVGNAFFTGENMSHVVAQPRFDWSTGSSRMYTPSAYAEGASRGTPMAATPGSLGSGSGPSPDDFQEQQRRAAKRAKTEDEDEDADADGETEPPSGDS